MANSPKNRKDHGREARRHPRYTKIIHVECTLIRFPDDVFGEKSKIKVGESFRATTINVSETGMLVNCDFLMPERTVLEVTFPEGEVLEKKARLRTQIAWTKRNAYKIFGRYAAGLSITEGEKSDIEKLIKYFN